MMLRSLPRPEPAALAALISCVIADDQPIALRGLRGLLEAESDLAVLAQTTDAESALETAARLRPQVLVSDLNLVSGDLAGLLEALVVQAPGTATVVITPSRDGARRALAAGAAGCVLKGDDDGELLSAIRAAAAGRSHLSPRLAARLEAETPAVPPSGLSYRQVEILSLLAMGHTNVQIGERLALSTRTVESHRAQIMRRIRATERYELVEFALTHGLIGPSAR